MSITLQATRVEKVQKGRAKWFRQWPGPILLLPAFLLVALLIIFPVTYNFWLGFFNKHTLLQERQWVAFDNYTYILHDEQFWESFRLGVIYSAVSIAFQLLLGIAAALLLNEAFWGRSLLRGLVLFPYMIPTVVAVIVWKWIFNDQYGIINYWLLSLGIIDRPIVWLGPEVIFTSLILVSIWTYFPFVVISVLARMQTIPPDLYDAAKVDGAGVVGRFVHVTLPQIRNVLFIVILLRGIWMFTKFDIVWLWAGSSYGGLGEHLRTLPLYTYQRMFGFYQAGLGAAIANVMFVLLLVAVIIYFHLFRREEDL